MVEQRKVDPSPSALRDLVVGLAVSAVGCVGWLGPVGSSDSVGLLIWLAILAPAAGCLTGALGVRLWPFAFVAPGVWMVALAGLAGLDGSGAQALPTPMWGALAWTGLFAAGFGLGRASGGGTRAFALAGGVALIAAGLVALPTKGGTARTPWPEAAARVLLDASPATLVVESAGVDWMRHPAVYEPVRTDRFQRLPYRGVLAGPITLVVGCLVAFGAGFATRSAGGAED